MPLVVLVAIDGVRWQDVFVGPGSTTGEILRWRKRQAPSLLEMEHSGVALGSFGEPGFYASGPNFVSLPGYMEMLSGSTDLACADNGCKTMERATLLDDFQTLDPSDRTRVGAFSSWDQIVVAASRHGSGVVSAGRTAGYGHKTIERFPKSADAFRRGKENDGGWGPFRFDSITARLARSFLFEAGPDFLFVSLGETDEFGHKGDYPNYFRALRRADEFVGALRRDLRLLSRVGRESLLLVTTDHGRAKNFSEHGREYPESARSFLFVEGSGVRRQSPKSAQVAYLRDIAPTVRAVTGLASCGGPGTGRVLHEILRT